jgi:apolipoprotein N-acyltransferase
MSSAPHRAAAGRLARFWLWLAVPAGLAHALSMAWPFALGWPQGQPVAALQVASLVALVALLERCSSGRQAGLLAWLFATAMLAGTFWWLFISMHVYGGLPAALAVLAVLALAAALGLYYALAGALYWRWRSGGAARRVLLWAGLWLLAELARVVLFTGFPWGQSGYAHIDGWARPLAGWIGVHGLSWLSAAVAGALALWLLPAPGQLRRLRPALLLLAGAIALAWAPIAPQTQAPRPALSLTLVQGNIAQDEKFIPGRGLEQALRFYAQELKAAQTSLVVLPETAIPLLPAQLDAAYWQDLRDHFAKGEQAALLGMPMGSFEQGYTNSVLGLQAGLAAPYRYDKHHLVPFGEFIPPLFKWFVRMMNIPLGDFNRGAIGQPSFVWQGERLAPNICYEDLFGEELGARFADPQQAPTIMVNVSNIAWFGDTVAIDQHLHISRMRTLELSRPMVRATNTGATVVIDAQGRVTHALPRHTQGRLQAQVQGHEGLTLYARAVAHLGLLPWYGFALLGVVAAMGRRTSGARPHA